MPKPLLVAAIGCLTACASGAPPAPAEAPVPAPSPAAHVPASARPGIAVFPFTNGGAYGRNREDLAAMEVGIQQMLLTELQQNPALRIVERSALRHVLDEQNLATAGRVDAATAAQVGRLMGARYGITGAFMDLNGNFRLDGRIIDAETGEVIRAVRIQNQRRENLYPLLVDLAQQIMAGVELPPLAAATQQARRQRRVPDEAAALYSRAVFNAENGRKEQAIELYRRIVASFPDYTEAREELRQLEVGG
ncbi:MAG TPA: CsgG/HfaB family protein [Longimicrobiaceae bacterium]|nr:CsgG/HfaB family protein [Longimicrobiaceae bacterium]